MRLLPREQDRLLLFLAAELARKRRGRGLRLNQAEAVALIADKVCEAARDGCSYAAAEAAGYRAGDRRRGRGRRRAGRPRGGRGAVRRRQRLLVLHDPIGAAGPPARRRRRSSGSRRSAPLTVVNEGEVPVGVTSHFHFFEVNRALRFDRAAAWGMRLAIAPGAKVFFAPGVPREVLLMPFGGARVIRGHAGLADGPLDAEARARPRWRWRASGGTAVPEPGAVRLADSDLWLVPEPTRRAGPTGSCPASATRCATAWACARSAAGSRWRSSAGWSRTRCSASLHEPRHPRRADRRDRPRGQPGHDGRRRGRARHGHRGRRRDGHDRHARRRRPARALALAAGRRRRAGRRHHDARDPGLRPGLEPRHQPGRGHSPPTWAALEAYPLNAALLVRASSSRPEPVVAALRAGGGGPEDPRGRRRGPEQIRSALTSPTRTTSSSRSTPTGSTRRCRSRTRSRRSAAARSTPSTSRAAAAATRRTCSRWPGASRAHLVDLADDPVRRRRRGRAPRDGRGRARARAGRSRGRLDRAASTACGRRRWPPRACCTTSA